MLDFFLHLFVCLFACLFVCLFAFLFVTRRLPRKSPAFRVTQQVLLKYLTTECKVGSSKASLEVESVCKATSASAYFAFDAPSPFTRTYEIFVPTVNSIFCHPSSCTLMETFNQAALQEIYTKKIKQDSSKSVARQIQFHNQNVTRKYDQRRINSKLKISLRSWNAAIFRRRRKLTVVEAMRLLLPKSIEMAGMLIHL